MNLFVTGGTGFVGSHFVKYALEQGDTVYALKRKVSQPRIDLEKQPIWLEGDLDTDVSETLKKCEILVHLAAVGVNPNAANWEECFKWNVHSSLNLWLEAWKSGIQKLIVVGSCFEYGSSGEDFDYIPTDAPLTPTGAYASSKAAASMAALGLAVEKNWQVEIFRLFHVYGEGEAENRLYPSLKRAAREHKDFPMTKGEQIRDFIHVSDTAKKIHQSLKLNFQQKGKPSIRNIGSGNPQSIFDFSQKVWNTLNSTGQLLPGAIPYRQNEIMRYVPLVSE